MGMDYLISPAMFGNGQQTTIQTITTQFHRDQNPQGPLNGRFKVIRGGSWHSGGMCVQTYYRNGLSPSWIDFAVGFRCVKTTNQ